MRLTNLFISALNLIIPPRETEETVSVLSIEELSALADQDGSLPYHDEQIKALVWEIKYRRNKKALFLAGEYLSEQLAGLAGEEIGTPLLIPVPMHKSRLRERGFNQTELLCKETIARLEAAYEYVPEALLRTRDCPPQQTLARAARLSNAAHSMRAATIVKDRTCVVIDDVATTGATFKEACRALKEAGAKKVHCVALARSLH